MTTKQFLRVMALIVGAPLTIMPLAVLALQVEFAHPERLWPASLGYLLMLGLACYGLARGSERKTVLPPLEFDRPSEEFWDAICDAGGSWKQCGFCGRTHFNDEYQNSNPEDHAVMLTMCKTHPDTFFNHHDWGIGFGSLVGKDAVYDCPCNLPRRYEDFIISERHLILKFLNLWAAKLESESAKEKQLVDSAASV